MKIGPINVPIYDLNLWICVGADIPGMLRDLEKEIGEQEVTPCVACCAYKGGNFALLFDPQYLTPNVLGHEVFHLTHRMMEWGGVTVDKYNHEAGAFLQGHLMDVVYRRVRRYLK